MKDFSWQPLLVTPYDVRRHPRAVPAPDIFDCPQVQICINAEWASHLDGLLERLLFVDAWLGEDEDIDRAIEQVRTLLGHLKVDNMSCCCGNNGALTRYNENGELEISYDNGATWQPYPQGDPRMTGTKAPPIPGADGDDKKCAAAASIVQHFKNELIDQQSSWTGVTNAVEVVIAIIAAIVTGGVAVPVIIVLVGEMIGAGLDAVSAAFTTAVYDQFQCILYCRMEDNASFTEAGWQNVQSDCAEQFAGIAGSITHDWVSSLGPVGLTNAARLRLVASADCSLCDCPVECPDNFDIWDRTGEGYPAGYFGTILEREDNRIRVQFNSNYITLTTSDVNDCCSVADWTVVEGGAVYSTAHNLCGEPFDGAFEHEATVLNQCVWIFEFQALGADRPILDIFFDDCP